MNILVTGAAGFIGSAYVHMLLSHGAMESSGISRITVLDKLTYAGTLRNLDLADPRLRFVHGDICDASLVDELMAEVEQVVHFAAESHVDRSISAADEFMRTNVLGTHTLLDAASRHKVDRFVHVSTDEVYGSVELGSSSETAPLAPNSPYAASKAASDLVALAYHRTHGLDVRVTRCCNNYGPRQFPGVNSLIITVFGEEEQSGNGFQHALELADRAAVAATFPAEHPPCLHLCHGVLDGSADLAEDGVEFTLPVEEIRSAEALEWHDPDAVDSDVTEVGASIS